MLLGTIPLGRAIQLDDGRQWTVLEARSLDEWRYDAPGTAVLFDHDPMRPVGWVTKAVLHREQLHLYGEPDDTFNPLSQGCTRLIRAGITNGLSPLLVTSQGHREFANHTSGIGEVHRIPEVSIVGNPRIDGARWLAT